MKTWFSFIIDQFLVYKQADIYKSVEISAKPKQNIKQV
jgi:hypothetical protein